MLRSDSAGTAGGREDGPARGRHPAGAGAAFVPAAASAATSAATASPGRIAAPGSHESALIAARGLVNAAGGTAIGSDVAQAVRMAMANNLRPHYVSTEESELLREAQRRKEWRARYAAGLKAQREGEEAVLSDAVVLLAEQCFGALRRLPALRYFDDESLHRLVRRGRVRRFDRYQCIYSQGSPAYSLLVLVEGGAQCRAATDAGPGRDLAPFSVLGLETLAGLDGDTPTYREETAMATQPCIAMLLPHTALCSMLKHGTVRPEVMAELRRVTRHVSK